MEKEIKNFLMCNRCGNKQEDEGDNIICIHCNYDFLSYKIKDLSLDTLIKRGSSVYNLWDYNIIPSYYSFNTLIKPNIYYSVSLSKELNTDIYIAFSGYFPERGFYSETGTFKDLEMYVVASRFYRAKNTKKLIGLCVPSSGNTSRAMINVSVKYKIPLKVVVPFKALSKLWIIDDKNIDLSFIKNNILLYVVRNDTYDDAINYSRFLCTNGFIVDGGYRNPARRIAVGTLLLEFYRKYKDLPTHYVQAVGSATGPLGIEDVRKQLFNNHKIYYLLSQDPLYAPLYSIIYKGEIPKRKNSVLAEELTNSNPPYEEIRKMMYYNGGSIDTPTHTRVRKAQRLFESIEGIDIETPSAFALASLMNYLEYREKRNTSNDRILLHITGGGISRIKEEKDVLYLSEMIEINEIGV